jgi:hypothetical protein
MLLQTCRRRDLHLETTGISAVGVPGGRVRPGGRSDVRQRLLCLHIHPKVGCGRPRISRFLDQPPKMIRRRGLTGSTEGAQRGFDLAGDQLQVEGDDGAPPGRCSLSPGSRRRPPPCRRRRSPRLRRCSCAGSASSTGAATRPGPRHRSRSSSNRGVWGRGPGTTELSQASGPSDAVRALTRDAGSPSPARRAPRRRPRFSAGPTRIWSRSSFVAVVASQWQYRLPSIDGPSEIAHPRTADLLRTRLERLDMLPTTPPQTPPTGRHTSERPSAITPDRASAPTAGDDRFVRVAGRSR